MKLNAARTAGTLELFVRYVRDTTERFDSTRRQYLYEVTSRDSDITSPYTGTDLCSGVGARVDADDMIRALAGFLGDAGERYRTSMCPPDDDYPAWVYEAAYLNYDDLAMLSLERKLNAVDDPPAPTYISVTFQEGDDAAEALRILDEHGPQAALEHLAQWDFGQETDYTADAMGHVYTEPPSGHGDETYTRDDYVMTTNKPYGYVGLLRKIDPPAEQDPPTIGSQDRSQPDTTRERSHGSGRSSSSTQPSTLPATDARHDVPPPGM